MKWITLTIASATLISIGYSAAHANQADLLCSKVNEIKIVPFKGEWVDDEIYNGLISNGKNAALCLAKKITDTTIMSDPRKTPPYEGITVGDVALFVIVDITRLDFEQLLPISVRSDYKNEGIYAYFKYVDHPENRKVIQEKAYKAIGQMKK